MMQIRSSIEIQMRSSNDMTQIRPSMEMQIKSSSEIKRVIQRHDAAQIFGRETVVFFGSRILPQTRYLVGYCQQSRFFIRVSNKPIRLLTGSTSCRTPNIMPDSKISTQTSCTSFFLRGWSRDYQAHPKAQVQAQARHHQHDHSTSSSSTRTQRQAQAQAQVTQRQNLPATAADHLAEDAEAKTDGTMQKLFDRTNMRQTFDSIVIGFYSFNKPFYTDNMILYCRQAKEFTSKRRSMPMRRTIRVMCFISC